MSHRRFRPGLETLALRLAPSTVFVDVPCNSSIVAIDGTPDAPFTIHPRLAPLPSDFVDRSMPTEDPMAPPKMPPTDL